MHLQMEVPGTCTSPDTMPILTTDLLTDADPNPTLNHCNLERILGV